MCDEQMQKARERRRALRKANEAAERARLEAEWKAQLEKQKAHEKVNHPVRTHLSLVPLASPTPSPVWRTRDRPSFTIEYSYTRI